MHSRITYGLKKALEDGSFERLSYQYYGEDIINAKLDSRTLFHLPNSYMSAIDKKQQVQFSFPFIIEKTETFRTPHN